MIKKISDYFLKIASLRTFLAALAIYLVFGTYVMPTGAKKFEEKAGQKVEILDLQFTYSPAKARQIIDKYGQGGRDYAIQFGLVADTFYPVAYTFLFLIITSLIFKNLKSKGLNTGSLHLFPLVIVPVDYMENLSIANVMLKYPQISDNEIQIASFFTSLKWCLVAGLILIILGALVLLVTKKPARA